jgi:phytoene dehydrogenase-like protein
MHKRFFWVHAWEPGKSKGSDLFANLPTIALHDDSKRYSTRRISMEYDVVVVGGGIAGLTAASYCARENLTVLLCEKQAMLGGTVNSFEREGFVFDLGIRSIENSGIIFPMLEQLGIEMDFIRSLVSVGVADQVLNVDTAESLEDYVAFLKNQFPDNTQDIDRIMQEIRKTMGYMDVLYGIDNPLLLDSMYDIKYMTKTLLPWSF